MIENNKVDLGVHEAGHLVFGLCDIYGLIEPLCPSAIWINEIEEEGKVCNFSWFKESYLFHEDIPLVQYKKEACKVIGARVAEHVLNNRRKPNFGKSLDEDEDSLGDIVKFGILIRIIVKLETGISVTEKNMGLSRLAEDKIWNDCIEYLQKNINAQEAIKYVVCELKNAKNNIINGSDLTKLVKRVNEILKLE